MFLLCAKMNWQILFQTYCLVILVAKRKVISYTICKFPRVLSNRFSKYKFYFCSYRLVLPCLEQAVRRFKPSSTRRMGSTKWRHTVAGRWPPSPPRTCHSRATSSECRCQPKTWRQSPLRSFTHSRPNRRRSSSNNSNSNTDSKSRLAPHRQLLRFNSGFVHPIFLQPRSILPVRPFPFPEEFLAAANFRFVSKWISRRRHQQQVIPRLQCSRSSSTTPSTTSTKSRTGSRVSLTSTSSSWRYCIPTRKIRKLSKKATGRRVRTWLRQKSMLKLQNSSRTRKIFWQSLDSSFRKPLGKVPWLEKVNKSFVCNRLMLKMLVLNLYQRNFIEGKISTAY